MQLLTTVFRKLFGHKKHTYDFPRYPIFYIDGIDEKLVTELREKFAERYADHQFTMVTPDGYFVCHNDDINIPSKFLGGNFTKVFNEDPHMAFSNAKALLGLEDDMSPGWICLLGDRKILSKIFEYYPNDEELKDKIVIIGNDDYLGNKKEWTSRDYWDFISGMLYACPFVIPPDIDLSKFEVDKSARAFKRP